jgi:hypothetical protein
MSKILEQIARDISHHSIKIELFHKKGYNDLSPLGYEAERYVGPDGRANILGMIVAVFIEPELNEELEPTGRIKLVLKSSGSRFERSSLSLDIVMSIDADGAGATILENKSTRELAAGGNNPLTERAREIIECAVLDTIPTWMDANLFLVNEAHKRKAIQMAELYEVTCMKVEDSARQILAEMDRIRSSANSLRENAENLFPDYVNRKGYPRI